MIRLVFERFRQLGGARQAHLSLSAEGVFFPRPSDGKRLTSFDWTPIRYRNVIGILKNPFYAGAYVYGKNEKRIAVVDGRARKSYGHVRPAEDWDVVIHDHHEGLSIGASTSATSPCSPPMPTAASAVRSRAGGPRTAGGYADLRPLRARAGGRLRGRATGPPDLSLRPPQPDAGPAVLPRLRWPQSGRGDGGGDTSGGRADGHGGGAGGRADASGGRGGAQTRRGTRSRAGAI